MFFLLSNDDGYLSPGLQALRTALLPLASRIVVMAPLHNCSGQSHAITLRHPLSVGEHAPDYYYVEGTPTDCVHIGVNGYFRPRPDLVISGINHGANMGSDVIYSGTVGAAFEGRGGDLPALAFSVCAHIPQHLNDAAAIAAEIVAALSQRQWPRNAVLNINIPDLPRHEIRGFRLTRLGTRGKVGEIINIHDPRGRRMHWLGALGEGNEYEEGSDFAAIAARCVSITPLSFDLTDAELLRTLADWPLGSET